MKPICVVISFKPLTDDPRINRQVHWLSEDYQVFTIGPSNDPTQDAANIDCGLYPRSFLEKGWRGFMLGSRQYETFYWQSSQAQVTLSQLRRIQPELIIANEIECLPVALKARQLMKTKVVFDAHEFYPALYEDNSFWRILVKPYMLTMCRKYIPKADLSITASQSFAKLYKQLCNVDMHLITNAPEQYNLTLKQHRNPKIRLIHHGITLPDRKPERLIELMHHLDDRFELDLMFMPNAPEYLDKLKNMAANLPSIRFIPPVPMKDIVKSISDYDMGVHILPPTNLNNATALPNKFFEFLQARLGIAINPSPEMASLIHTYHLGVVSEDHSSESLAKVINPLTKKDIWGFRKEADRLSKLFSAEQNGQKLRELISQFKKDQTTCHQKK